MDHDRITANAARRLQERLAATPIELARIPGTALSQAMHGLPPPDNQLRDGEVVVPWIGRIRVTFERVRGRRGARDFWTPRSAIVLYYAPGTTCPASPTIQAQRTATESTSL